VSVVIPTKDRAALLRQALASVRAIEGPDLSLEVLVVNDGSSDATPAVAREFRASLVRAPRPGAAAARNAGMRAATAAYIAFLDDDDVWAPSHLRPHIAFLEARPDFDAVVGQAANADEALEAIGPAWPADLPRSGDVLGAFLTYYPQIGATVVRRGVLESVGYMDEGLLSDEDWDWHFRLALKLKVGFVPCLSVLFRQRQAGRNDDLEWMRLKLHTGVFWRNYRAAAQRLPIHLAAQTFLQQRGRYAKYFIESAKSHAACGEQQRLRRALLFALLASPAHAARLLLLERQNHRLLAAAVQSSDGALAPESD
jgi:glycosyltransferase involved in cell wall biosynthesis